VLLPDGEVFVTNGADRDEVDGPGSGTPVYQTELVDPDKGTVTAGPSLDKDHGRTYHNTAVLLPDGRVLIGGHAPIATGYAFQDDTAHTVLGFSSPEADSTFQIYSPPYLSYGPRPVIDDVQPWTRNNTTLTIQTPQASGVSKVVLVRNPSATHLTDGDQRNVQLAITRTGDDSVTVRIPDSTVLPPGPYMLFVETPASNGPAGALVPSVSKQVFVADAPPRALDQTTATTQSPDRASGDKAATPTGHESAAAARPKGMSAQPVVTVPVAAARAVPKGTSRWPVAVVVGGVAVCVIGGRRLRRRTQPSAV